MAAKKENHRQERAKKILSGRKSGGKADMLKSLGKKSKSGLSGAAPKAFSASGLSPKMRQDKIQRKSKPDAYAAGGGVDGDAPKKKSGAKTEVNIVIAGKGEQGASMPQPVPVPMPPPGAGMPPGPPRPPMGGPPPGGMPPRPPGAMRRGGGVKEEYPIDAGAGGGKGRLEKAAAYKRTDKGKKRD